MAYPTWHAPPPPRNYDMPPYEAPASGSYSGAPYAEFGRERESARPPSQQSRTLYRTGPPSASYAGNNPRYETDYRARSPPNSQTGNSWGKRPHDWRQDSYRSSRDVNEGPSHYADRGWENGPAMKRPRINGWVRQLLQRIETLSIDVTLTEHQQVHTLHPTQNHLQLDPDVLAQSPQLNQPAQSIQNASTIAVLLLAVQVVQISRRHLTIHQNANFTTLRLVSLTLQHRNLMLLDQGTILIALSTPHHLEHATKPALGQLDHYLDLILRLLSRLTMTRRSEIEIGKTG